MKLLDIQPKYINEELARKICRNSELKGEYIKKYGLYGGMFKKWFKNDKIVRVYYQDEYYQDDYYDYTFTKGSTIKDLKTEVIKDGPSVENIGIYSSITDIESLSDDTIIESLPTKYYVASIIQVHVIIDNRITIWNIMKGSTIENFETYIRSKTGQQNITLYANAQHDQVVSTYDTRLIDKNYTFYASNSF